MPRRSVRTLSVASLILALAALVPLVALAFDGFADVDSAAFYHADANWLRERRITLGCGGSNFCPDQVVTRGQMASFLHRTANVRETPGFSLTSIDSAGNVGAYTSVTIGADGLGLISYFDNTNGDLKVAHCSNAFCVPNHRRR